MQLSQLTDNKMCGCEPCAYHIWLLEAQCLDIDWLIAYFSQTMYTQYDLY